MNILIVMRKHIHKNMTFYYLFSNSQFNFNFDLWPHKFIIASEERLYDDNQHHLRHQVHHVLRNGNAHSSLCSLAFGDFPQSIQSNRLSLWMASTNKFFGMPACIQLQLVTLEILPNSPSVNCTICMSTFPCDAVQVKANKFNNIHLSSIIITMLMIIGLAGEHRALWYFS